MMNLYKLPFKLYNTYGHYRCINHPITQTQHAIQCGIHAQNYVKSINIDNPSIKTAIILGAFFHDIGHLLIQDTSSINLHDPPITPTHRNSIGAAYLKQHDYPKTTLNLVKMNTQIDHYLMNIKDDYTREEITNQYTPNHNIQYVSLDSHVHYKLNEWDKQSNRSDSHFLDTIESNYPIEYFEEQATLMFNKT